MSSVPVVVVIVGVVIVVLATVWGEDGPKPATPDRAVEAAPRSTSIAVGPFESAFPVVGAELEPRTDISVPLRPRRLRSLALLVLTAAALGTLAGGLIGGSVLLGARLLNRALG